MNALERHHIFKTEGNVLNDTHSKTENKILEIVHKNEKEKNRLQHKYIKKNTTGKLTTTQQYINWTCMVNTTAIHNHIYST
jgi:hypothetical protein